MWVSASEANKRGVVISKSKMTEATGKYIKMYNSGCKRLFDLGFQSSPSVFDRVEFRLIFFETYPDMVHYFINQKTGMLEDEILRVEYVIRVCDDEEVRELLKIARLVLKADEALKAYNNFCTLKKFHKKSDTITVKSAFTVSDHVYNANKFMLDNPYIQECFYYSDDKMVLSVDFRIEIYKTLLAEVGVVLDSVDYSAEALILGKGFTIADDVNYLSLIIEGSVIGSGEYGLKVYNAVEDYYTSYYQTTTTKAICPSRLSILFNKALPKCISLVECTRETLKTERTGFEEFYITDDCVYFLVDRTSSAECVANKRVFNIGSYLVNSFTGERISVVGQLLGWGGEFVSEYDIMTSDGYKSTGMPILIPHIVPKKRGRIILEYESYYPVYNIRDSAGKTVKPHVDINHLYHRNVDKLLEELDVSSVESLPNEVKDTLDIEYGEHTNSFKLLCGILFQGLICTMCDYILDGHSSSEQIILDSSFDWVDEQAYIDASVQVESLFNILKL